MKDIENEDAPTHSPSSLLWTIYSKLRVNRVHTVKIICSIWPFLSWSPAPKPQAIYNWWHFYLHLAKPSTLFQHFPCIVLFATKDRRFLSHCARIHLNSEVYTDCKGLHELEFFGDVIDCSVVTPLVHLHVSQVQFLQFSLQFIELPLLQYQILLSFLQALAAHEGSVGDFELTSDFFLQFFCHSFALSVVHPIEFLLLLPEVLKGLFDFLIEVVVRLDLPLGVVAVDLFIKQQFLNFYLIVPTGYLFLQHLLPRVVVDSIIDIV